MPSPFAHTLAVGLLADPRRAGAGGSGAALLALLVVSVNAPDLDFIPGMLAGNADRYHHGPSHSLIVALAWGLAVALAARIRSGGVPAARLGVAAGLAYASHVLLDTLCVDTRPPFGVPLFWPFWGGHVASPVELFMDIHRDRDTALFLTSLFKWHNLAAVAWEVLVMGSAVVLVRRLRSWRTVVHRAYAAPES